MIVHYIQLSNLVGQTPVLDKAPKNPKGLLGVLSHCYRDMITALHRHRKASTNALECRFWTPGAGTNDGSRVRRNSNIPVLEQEWNIKNYGQAVAPSVQLDVFIGGKSTEGRQIAKPGK